MGYLLHILKMNEPIMGPWGAKRKIYELRRSYRDAYLISKPYQPIAASARARF